MTAENSRRIFVQAGERVGLIGGDDGRCRREGAALVVLPDERWGNPVFADGCLDEADFHIHTRLTLDQLSGSGASVLLGGHYHYTQSRPEGNYTFRIVLDEDIAPANKRSLDKPMYIVYGMANPLKIHWSLEENRFAKQVVGKSLDLFRPGETFTIDIFRRDGVLTVEIDGRALFSISLRDGASGIEPGRCGDNGWPISVGFLPGHAPLRIHEFWAEGRFTGPVLPTSDVWHLNTDDYNSYRLPSLCRALSGRLLAFTIARRVRPSRAWEWEPSLCSGEAHCVLKRSDDAGRTWSEQHPVMDRGVSHEGRLPSPLVDSETGEIFLFMRGGPWVVSSQDEGRTWSEPCSLAGVAPGGIKEFAPGSGHCAIQLRYGKFPGRLLVAISVWGKHVVGLIYSDDHGRTWHPGALASFVTASEPSLVEFGDGRVLLSPRVLNAANPTGRLFMISHDGGKTIAETRFEPAVPMCGQGECVTVDLPGTGASDTRRAIVFCGETQGKTRLTLVASLDDGRTWPVCKLLDDGHCANLALVAMPEGQVGILYETDKYLRQRFMRVDLAKIIQG